MTSTNLFPFDDAVACDFATAVRHFAAVRDAGLAEVARYESREAFCCDEGEGITSSDYARLEHGATRAFIAGAAVAVLHAHAEHVAHAGGALRAVTINTMLCTSGGAAESDLAAALAAETENMRGRRYGSGLSEMISGDDANAAFWLGVTAEHVGAEAAEQAPAGEDDKPVRVAARFASNIDGQGLPGDAVSVALGAYSQALYARAEGRQTVT
jgi:hypothetical protein